MSAWLANNIPSWLLLLGLCALVAGGAVLVQMFARRRFPALRDDAHNDVMVVLSHPYIGEIATSPEPLREVVAFLSPSSS